ncbi:MAG: hypothetical protein E6R09_08415, partial [Rhodocyclaceae bacterium]
MRALRDTAFFLLGVLSMASPLWADFEEDYESKKWQEVEVQLPAAPREENLLSFYVSAATSNT